MTLIDTSSFVHFLRLKGDRRAKQRVAGLLESGAGAICEIVAVELWMGVGSSADKREIEELCSLVSFLPLTESVWARAKQLAARCRSDGTLVPSSDIIIAACAFVHHAALDFEDQHFLILEKHRGCVL